ncbi:MAG: CHAD domain-containing protein [Acidimicrobiia bacterium]
MFDRSSVDPALRRFALAPDHVPGEGTGDSSELADMRDVVSWMTPAPPREGVDRVVWFDTADRRVTKSGGAVVADRHGWTVVGPWAESGQRVASAPGDSSVGGTGDRGAAPSLPDEVLVASRELFGTAELESVAASAIAWRTTDLIDGGGRCVIEVRVERWDADPPWRAVLAPAPMAPAVAIKVARRRLEEQGWIDADPWHVAPIDQEVAVEDEDVEDASMAKTQAAALRTIATNVATLRSRALAVVAEGDATDVHEARVAARRLRSALSTFAPVLDPAWRNLVHADVKWVGRELGNVRTHQVMLAGLSDHAHEIGGSDGDALLLLIDEQIVEERRLLARLEEVLGGDRFAAMLSGAEQPVVVDEHVRLDDLASQSWAKLVASMDQAATGDIADLHKARLAAKKMRYALEAAGDALSGTGRVVRRLTDLQDHIGAMVDGLDLDRWCRQRAAAADTPVSTVLALGRVIERESHSVDVASQRWPRTWARLQRRVAKQWPKW